MDPFSDARKSTAELDKEIEDLKKRLAQLISERDKKIIEECKDQLFERYMKNER